MQIRNSQINDLMIKHTFMQIWNFLGFLRHRAIDTDQLGCSWLELLIVFELHGGTSEADDASLKHRACARGTTRLMLAQLAKVFKQVVAHCVSLADQRFLPPARPSV